MHAIGAQCVIICVTGSPCSPNLLGESRFLSDQTSIALTDRIRSNFHPFVAEAFQGQGIARSLWEQAKAECLERATQVR
jgi:hypothetical protein